MSRLAHARGDGPPGPLGNDLDAWGKFQHVLILLKRRHVLNHQGASVE